MNGSSGNKTKKIKSKNVPAWVLSNPEYEKLEATIKQIPMDPGVYLMKNKLDQVIYVGKAKRLRQRVRNYFTKSGDGRAKIKYLVQKIFDIEFIVTESEVEAFLVEASLIKKYKPRYNIRLKDDKSYPYIHIDKKHPFPRFYLSRRVKQNQDLYFGPYTSSYAVRQTMQFLNETYFIRDCSDTFMKSQKRPCMTAEIGRCHAPCVQEVTEQDYNKKLKKAVSFLKGRNAGFFLEVEKKMKQAAKNEDFEKAARLRDGLESMKSLLDKQVMVSKGGFRDVVGLYEGDDGTALCLLNVRDGRVIGIQPHYIRQKNITESKNEWVLSFLNQYYSTHLIPDEVWLDFDLGKDLFVLFRDVLRERSQKEIQVGMALSEDLKKQIMMAQKNAKLELDKSVYKEKALEEGLEWIMHKFNLPEYPHRIECYDISHTSGFDTVASQVVFTEGVPSKEDYRRYKIKFQQNVNNDYESMREVLKRRFSHKEWQEPQLILIDGGKGQLNAVKQALVDVGKSQIPLVSIAKSRTEKSFEKTEVKKTSERIFLVGRQNPIPLRENHPSFMILTQLRDEAHRFAIEFHRSKRDKSFKASLLDDIKGLGPKKTEALIKAYPDILKLKEAVLDNVAVELKISKDILEQIVAKIDLVRARTKKS